jgi:hypothetical protein
MKKKRINKPAHNSYATLNKIKEYMHTMVVGWGGASRQVTRGVGWHLPAAAGVAMEVGGRQCTTERGTIEAAGGSSRLYPIADLPWQWRATMTQEGTMKRQSRCSDLIHRCLHRLVVSGAARFAVRGGCSDDRTAAAARDDLGAHKFLPSPELS